jgi:heat shock protein HspQ
VITEKTRGYKMKNNILFTVGQTVYHKHFNYRGVIIDVDPKFMGSENWYEKVAKSRPPKDQPWYHILVDNASQQTYVAQRHLIDDQSEDPINNPEIEHHFSSFTKGKYDLGLRIN